MPDSWSAGSPPTVNGKPDTRRSIDFARDEARDLVAAGERIKAAAAVQLPSVHPEKPDIHTINQTMFAGPLRVENGQKRAKNAVVVSPGRIDRCPCGTGTSARVALMHARGERAIGKTFEHKSIIDTVFQDRAAHGANVGSVAAVTPEVSGRAWLTGISHYGVDPEDPVPEGYRLNDTWFAWLKSGLCASLDTGHNAIETSLHRREDAPFGQYSR